MIVMERSYATKLDTMWQLWTTQTGFESWWGPHGFDVRVVAIDVQTGGSLTYELAAVGADQVAYMTEHEIALVSIVNITYTEVTPRTRLRYVTRADFVPGVAPYDVTTEVRFSAGGPSVRIELTSDDMHDDRWTEMARRGHAEELERLAACL